MVFITTLAKEVNKLSESSPELEAYLKTIKDWKAFTEGDLAKIIANEETKIGQESLFTVEQTRER